LLCSVNDAGNVLPSTCVYLNGRLSGSGAAGGGGVLEATAVRIRFAAAS
jgi:hypothetical protein